ncbi:MAG: exodeoxyribonuclease VII small subunit [Flaviflexus sp.]|uniref:Exodeoxyribonuclease 7 small subunit n=1 Tax=Flaviflexus ciconiae TaxID=2496867 RepID=A0A3Q9G5S6_9ACTO|nr:exodeoxyribonuclease VII small subunit [Flaviflexus ciconiae]AZQ78011.1 exodeoxyribonuclease VII small subunit [Flaviflexus ciconiae]
MTEKKSNEDVAGLSYEDARQQLIEIVTRLEQGTGSLEESITAWERGEALARRCQQWLDGARARLQAAQVGKSVPADSAEEDEE